MGQGGTDEPGGVGVEASGRYVLESGRFFEVPDGELNVGMAAAEGVDIDRVTVEIGQEGEVAPLGPQGGLASDEPGASHDESAALVVAFGHFSLAIFAVVDWRPRRLVDARNHANHGF